MISESRDTEDCSNDAENTDLNTEINYSLIDIKTEIEIIYHNISKNSVS